MFSQLIYKKGSIKIEPFFIVIIIYNHKTFNSVRTQLNALSAIDDQSKTEIIIKYNNSFPTFSCQFYI